MISKLAHIHPDARIGENVTIGPFAYVAADVVIGDGCHIAPSAVILDGARIGKNCRIHSSAVIAGEPQDLKFRGEVTTAEIGDNTTVRECVTVNRGTASRGKTVVGGNCLLMAYSHVAHDCVLGNGVIVGNASQLAGEVEIDDCAILSGGVLIHQFTRIGKHVIVQGGSRTGKDVPPYIMAGREPLSFAGINVVGLRRRGFTQEKICEIQNIMRILFQSGYAYTKACDIIESELPQSPERDEIVNFVRSSRRGILRSYTLTGKSDDLD